MDNAGLLRRWREARGLTVTAAADLVGATHPAWLSWESGQKRPTELYRLSIEKLTDGAVLSRGWLSREERRALDRVRPFGVAA